MKNMNCCFILSIIRLIIHFVTFVILMGEIHSWLTSINSFSLSELMPKVKAEQVETVEGCTHEVNA